jgi:hypothetical protein
MQVLIAAQKIHLLIDVTTKLLGENYRLNLEATFAGLLYEGLPDSREPGNLEQLKKAYEEIKEKEYKFIEFIEDMLSVLKDKKFSKILAEENTFVKSFINKLEQVREQHLSLSISLSKISSNLDFSRESTAMINNIKKAYECYFNVEDHSKLAIMFPKLDILMNDPKYRLRIDDYARTKIEKENKERRIYTFLFSSVPHKGPGNGQIYVQDDRNGKGKIVVTLCNIKRETVSFSMEGSKDNVKENEEAFRGIIVSEAVKQVQARKEDTLTVNSDRVIARLLDNPKKMTSQFSTQYVLRRGMLMDAFYKQVEKTNENRDQLEPTVLAVNKTKTVSNRAASGDIKKLAEYEIEKNKIVSQIQSEVKDYTIKSIIFSIFTQIRSAANLDTLPPDSEDRKSIALEKIIHDTKVNIKNSLSKLVVHFQDKEVGEAYLAPIKEFINRMDDYNFEQFIEGMINIVNIVIEAQASFAFEKELSTSPEVADSIVDVNSAARNGTSPIPSRPVSALVFRRDGQRNNSSEEESFSSIRPASAVAFSKGTMLYQNLSEKESSSPARSESSLSPAQLSSHSSPVEVTPKHSPVATRPLGFFKKQPIIQNGVPSKCDSSKVQEEFSTIFIEKNVNDAAEELRQRIKKQGTIGAGEIESMKNLSKTGNSFGLFLLAQAVYRGDAIPKDSVAAYYLAKLAMARTENLDSANTIVRFINKVGEPDRTAQCKTNLKITIGEKSYSPKELYDAYVAAEKLQPQGSMSPSLNPSS